MLKNGLIRAFVLVSSTNIILSLIDIMAKAKIIRMVKHKKKTIFQLIVVVPIIQM